jgi:hypothetical protein
MKPRSLARRFGAFCFSRAKQSETQAALDAALTQPQSFSVDGMQVTNQSVSNLIALEEQRAKKAGNAFGFRICSFKPPEQ